MTKIIGESIVIKYTDDCVHVLEPYQTPKQYGMDPKRE